MLKECAHAGLHEYVASLLPTSSVMSILDVGCGSGAWLNRIRNRGAHIVGIDYVQPQPLDGLDLRRFDINTDAFDSLGKFDLVTCIEVIEHIENVGKLLDLIRGTLAPRGMAVITTPIIESRRARTRALVSGKIPSFDNKSDPTHLMPILRDTLCKMLGRRGMVIDQLHQFPPNPADTTQFQRPVRAISKLLAALPDELYGDNLIYFMRHAT
jgi:2-polyprenyl-3-methyl-5-hydroxy-6-metoxy-1,4-benzoquinol methylase